MSDIQRTNNIKNLTIDKSITLNCVSLRRGAVDTVLAREGSQYIGCLVGGKVAEDSRSSGRQGTRGNERWAGECERVGGTFRDVQREKAFILRLLPL